MAAYAGKDFPEEANNKAPPSGLNRYFHNFCITICARPRSQQGQNRQALWGEKSKEPG
jgi:hypothetical protein